MVILLGRLLKIVIIGVTGMSPFSQGGDMAITRCKAYGLNNYYLPLFS